MGSIIVCYIDICVLMTVDNILCILSYFNLFFSVINKIIWVFTTFYGCSVKKQCSSWGKRYIYESESFGKTPKPVCPQTLPPLSLSLSLKDVSTLEGWKKWSTPVFWKSSPGGSDTLFLKVENHFKVWFFFNESH